MTAVPISRTQAFQYASDALLIGEEFCAPAVGVSLQQIILQHVHGYSEAASLVYVQIHSSANPPAAAAVPLVCIKVPIGLTFSWSAPSDGWECESIGGIDPADLGWWVSSTPDTYTASAETCWVNAQGIATVTT